MEKYLVGFAHIWIDYSCELLPCLGRGSGRDHRRYAVGAQPAAFCCAGLHPAFRPDYVRLLRWAVRLSNDWKIFNFKLATVTRVKLTEHLAKIPFRKYEEFVVGDVQSIIRNDVTAATEIMGMMTMLVANLFLLLVTGGYMVYINPKAGIIVVSVSIGFLL